MAIVPRKRKTGTVYYVANEWCGKQTWEKVGTSKRKAEQRDRTMKSEIKDGVYKPPIASKALTVGQYADTWVSGRKNAYAKDEKAILRRYIHARKWLAELSLTEVTPAHIDKLVGELRETLVDKTISNVLGILKLIFNSAIRAEHCDHNPVVLEPGTLKRGRKREPEIYEAPEVRVLTRHHSIPWPIRVLNALCLYTGMREGEACGRRWQDIREAMELPALSVHDQYGGQPLKTERPRMVPIHPELQEILEAWMGEGFELYTGRKPTPGDFIVPNHSRRAKVSHHTRSSYYKAFTRYAEAAGIRPRSLHSTRHTFLTLTARGGANKSDREKVTHNAAGDIVDRYTHDWISLCRVVLCLDLDAHQDLQLRGGSLAKLQGAPVETVDSNPRESPKSPDSSGVRFPAPPLQNSLKTRVLKTRVKKNVKKPELTQADLREANRRRKRRLLSLQEADPEAARPGLALCRALDAAYAAGAGDDSAVEEMERELEGAANG